MLLVTPNKKSGTGKVKFGSRYLLLIIIACSSFAVIKNLQDRPTLYAIGDSTVKNGKGKGDGGLWGWGNFLSGFFDSTRMRIENDALGGTSSRTFLTKGLWDSVLRKLKPGDFVLMQFGHNDSGALDDTARARGTIRGNNEDAKDIFNPITKQQETVRSYGWYLRKFITDTRSKGATPIVLSLIPRNSWKDEKINRASNDYGKWAAEAAAQSGVLFIDLNNIIADRYDQEGKEKVAKVYFTAADNTHTNEAGAKINAAAVVEGIRRAKECKLNNYLFPGK